MDDCLIIGGGPAGLTAAIYLIRKKAKILVLTQEVGGQILDGPLIENYPGFEKIPGREWVEKVRAQAEKLGVEIKENVKVEKIVKLADGFEVEGKGFEKIQAKSILICSGKRSRKLGVPGEEKFLGKGISHCITCDGPLFAHKTVAVIGGGNSAISVSLELEKYAEKVYLLNLGAKLVGEEVRVEQVEKSPKIEVIPQAKTRAIFGASFVEGLKYQDLTTGQEKTLALQGIFVEIGWEPSTGYLAGFLELTPGKEIKIDANNATSVPGVFAAGDVTEVKKKQLVISCGEAAKAALTCWEYLINKKS